MKDDRPTPADDAAQAIERMKTTVVGFLAVAISWTTLPLYIWIAGLLWNWYVASAFPAAPHLPWRFILGVVLIYSLLFSGRGLDYSPDDLQLTKKAFKRMCWSRFLIPTWLLMIGWIFKP